MHKKAQEIRNKLRRLESEAAQLVAESPSFHRVEHKIMTAANAIDDWLSGNKEKAPMEKSAPQQQQQQQQQQQTDAKLALEAINEVIERKTSPRHEGSERIKGGEGIETTS